MAGTAKLIEPLYDSYWLEEVGELPPMSDEWADVMLDFNKFCYHHMIIDKNGNAVRVILNEAQKKVAELLLSFAFARVPEPVDLAILKSRQMGISTVLILIEKYIACRKRNINIMHIMPVEKLATDFYTEKVEPLWQGSHSSLLPDTQGTTTPLPYMKVRKFAGRDMQVNIRYIGGNSKSAARSGTNQIIVGDEWAFQENPKRLERGVLATRPKTGLAMTVYVSTANGTNEFYDLCKVAQQKDSKIHFMFLPWHMLKEYEMPPDPTSRFADIQSWQPTEKDIEHIELFKQLGYPKESWIKKLAWYDHVFINEAKRDEGYMLAEYPSCVVAGTKVGTDRGIIDIENIVSGDIGTRGAISRMIKNPERPVATITTKNGYEVTGTYDHPIKSGDKFIDLIDTLGESIDLLPPTTAKDVYRVTWSELGVSHSIEITEDLAEWMGYWVGDGSYTCGVLDFVCNKRDMDLVDRITHLTKEIFGLEMYGRVVGSKSGGYNIRVGSKDIRDVLVKLDLLKLSDNGSWHNKKLRVPDPIWRSPLEAQQAFLRGLFEADGFVGDHTIKSKNGYVKIFTKNSDFAKDVQLLLLASGIVSKRRLRIRRVDKRDGSVKEYPGTELYLGSCATYEYKKIGFISRFKKDRLSKYNAPGNNAKPMLFSDEVVSVKESGTAVTYDITVPGDSTFDANGIWTHNCPEDPFLATGRPVFPIKKIKEWYSQNEDLKYTPIVMVETIERGRSKMTFEPAVSSGIHMFQEPQAGRRYMIGIDTSTNVRGGDASAGVVVDERTMEEVCSFNLDIDQDELAEMVVNLAKYYNRARIMPERNMGELFINSVTSVLGYSNVHIDTKSSTSRKVMYGVRVTTTSKREAIRRMKFLMNNDLYKAHDMVFIDQLLHYSYKELPSGDMKAEAVGTDENGVPNRDDSIAARLALVLSLNFSRWREYFNTTERKSDG